MKFPYFQKKPCLAIMIASFLLIPFLLQMAQALASEKGEYPRLNWRQTTPEGFGDLENNTAWSMKWWNGRLYVGTNRSWFCWSIASSSRKVLSPFLSWIYPPRDPDMECPEFMEDMPQQAEIWRWTPETDTWDMVYKSPNDVPNTTFPGKYTSRETGFRGMEIFTEPDGTEALYVTTVWSGMVNDGAPPPEILRSTDGDTFKPIPQDPGTFLGDFDKTSMRGLLVYNNKLYVIAGTVQGQGTLWEAEDPAGGNNNFRRVSPAGMSIWDFTIFNDIVYVGVREESVFMQPKSKQVVCEGYGIAKSDLSGDPPYTFQDVLTHGAYLQPDPSPTIVSIVTHNGLLYAGCDKPAEMIRLYPDDSWELVVGTPRETPDGWKYPISGFDAGFGVNTNVHIWRMVTHDGLLYAGTADQTMRYKENPLFQEAIEYRAGFDLYRTYDGWYWEPITTTGFGDEYQMGIRSLETTPYGLFVGSNNFWGGCIVYQGALPGDSGRAAPPPPPRRLEVEAAGESIVLSWEPPAGASRFHVYRADCIEGKAPLDWIPKPYVDIGTTEEFYFVDYPVPAHQRRHYIVKAEYEDKRLSDPSNFVIYPSLAPVQKFADLKKRVEEMAIRGKFASAQAEQSFLETIDEVEVPIAADQISGAENCLAPLHRALKERASEVLDPLYARELEVRFGKLIRRLRLAQAGVIDMDSL